MKRCDSRNGYRRGAPMRRQRYGARYCAPARRLRTVRSKGWVSGRERARHQIAGGARAASGDCRSARTTTKGMAVLRVELLVRLGDAAEETSGGPPAARHMTHCSVWCDAAGLPPLAWPMSSPAEAVLQMLPKATGWNAGAATATPMTSTNHTRTMRARMRE